MKLFDKFKPWKKDELEKILMKIKYRNMFLNILVIFYFLILFSISILLSILTSLILISFRLDLSFFLVLSISSVILFFYLFLTFKLLVPSIESIYITYWYRKNYYRKSDIFTRILKRYLLLKNLNEESISSIEKASVFLFKQMIEEYNKNNDISHSIDVYKFMQKVLSKELPTLLLFNHVSTKIQLELNKFIDNLECKKEINYLYDDISRIHKLYLEYFSIIPNTHEKSSSNIFLKLLSSPLFYLPLAFIISYLAYLFAFNSVGWYDIIETKVIDNNIEYYEYNFGIKNMGLLNIENFDMTLPFQSDESSIYSYSAVEDCKIIDGMSEINVHCNKIYKNGYFSMKWKSNKQISKSTQWISYQTSNVRFIPFFVLPNVLDGVVKNITQIAPQCPANYSYSDNVCKLIVPKGIGFIDILPLRTSFYSNSIAVVRFELYGSEKGSYTFITNWYNSSQLLSASEPTESSLDQFGAWNFWYLFPYGNNETWNFNVKLIWTDNKTEANASFLIVKNDSLTPFFSSTSCIPLNYSLINFNTNLISWDSRDEISQSNDTLSWIRENDISNSYNSTILFASKTRLLGIPTRIVKGQSSIGTEHYWSEVYFNNTWIPVDVSSNYPIGEYSTMYRENITILDC